MRWRLLTPCAVLLLYGCTTTPSGTGAPAAPAPISDEGVIARNERWLLYMPQAQDSNASIAARFLGSGQRDWEVAEANGGARPRAAT